MGYITINRTNFFKNLEIIAKLTGGIERIAVVLKDNAYGHGLEIVAQIAHEFGVRHVVVRTVSEALQVEKLFETVLVLADTPKKLYSNSIYFTINSLDDIEKIFQGSSVELKVNTGMNRNGISMDELERALERIEKKGLLLKGVFTHHSSADEENDIFDEQNRKFSVIKKELSSRMGEKVRFHSANSAALFRTRLANDEAIARVGIAAYGGLEDVRLQPVLSLYTQKIASRTLKKGESVGYSAKYTANTDEIVSTYDIGYADGFARLSDGVEYTTPKGKRLLGRVSMDNISLSGDDERVLLYDDAREYAKACKTISYEVLVRLSKDIKREVV